MGRNEEDRKTERLIREIEKHGCLYDKESPLYRDIDKKDKIWKEIASRVGMTIKDARQRWKSVRDNMRKNQNAMKGKRGRSAKTVRPYKFGAILKFLIPFLEDREPKSSLEKDEPTCDQMDEDNGDFEDNMKEELLDEETEVTFHAELYQSAASSSSETCSATPTTTPTTTPPTTPVTHGKRKRNLNTKECVDQSVGALLTEKENEIIKKRNAPSVEKADDDDVDQFLKSMATTIRKLPARAVADVKYKIHGIIHEAEMLYMFPSQDNYSVASTTVLDDRPSDACSPYGKGRSSIQGQSSMAAANGQLNSYSCTH
ncbi:uncharacterized protein LOC121389477 [Gigantopelta aegis]|uniref:uncharacterized protein LOC121389477 n=1 Tax=Gigantopelta aegis TaxID=1735272 RepID=UPI001B88ADED|nr:uncharacterized protein LOC121389477 [Gigantopelta aegis]